MSFSTDLWDKFESVARISSDNRKLFEEFTDLFEERAAAEESYSKTMEKITIALQKLQVGRTQGVQNVISSLKTNFMNRSEQSKALCESIRAEILLRSRQISNDQNLICKRLIGDGKKFEKDLKAAQENLEKAKLKFLRSEREAQSFQIQDEILKLSLDPSSEKRQKQAIKTKQQLTEVKELDQQYKYFLSEFNKTLSFYYEQMGRIMGNLQDFECERVNQMKDSVMKNIVFETSYLKNIEYDIDNISEKLDQVDAMKDIVEIIERSPQRRPMQEVIKYESYVSFIGVTLAHLEKKSKIFSKRGQSLDEIIEEYIHFKCIQNPSGEYVHETLTAEVKQLVDGIYTMYIDAQTEETKPKSFFGTIEEILDSNPLSRIIWAYCFNCLLKAKNEMSHTPFKNISIIFKAVLDNCLKNRDSITAKKVIQLSFSIFTTQQSLDIRRLRKHSDEQIQELRDELSRSLSSDASQQSVQLRIPQPEEQEEEEKADFPNNSNYNLDQIEPSSLLKKAQLPGYNNMPEKQSLQLQQQQQPQNEVQQLFRPDNLPIKKEKVYIQNSLIEHPIVKSKDFWESCAFESVVSELQVKNQRRIDRKEHFDMSKDKSIISGQLASISHIMLIFNYDKREIKDILLRYSRFFSLTDESINDLMFIVEHHVQKESTIPSIFDSESDAQSGNLLKDLGQYLRI